MTRRPNRFSYRETLPLARDERRRLLSQNFLVGAEAIAQLLKPLMATPGVPVVELGAGSGAITRELVARGRSVTAVELDPAWAAKLRSEFGTTVSVVEADLIGFRFPAGTYGVVSNVPYHLSTDLLRRLLSEPGWSVASLLLQWEVARKRAAVHGGTLLTASFWPWYEFELAGRVPALAFRPVPRVDGGILVLRRRTQPLVADRSSYQRLVERVFTGPGKGLRRILRPCLPPADFEALARRADIDPDGLPKDLDAEQWAEVYRAVIGRVGARPPGRKPGPARRAMPGARDAPDRGVASRTDRAGVACAAAVAPPSGARRLAGLARPRDRQRSSSMTPESTKT